MAGKKRTRQEPRHRTFFSFPPLQSHGTLLRKLAFFRISLIDSKECKSANTLHAWMDRSSIMIDGRIGCHRKNVNNL